MHFLGKILLAFALLHSVLQGQICLLLQASEARDGGWEEQPHAQGVVAVRAQEGLEEPSHAEGQEGRREEIPLIQGKEQRLCFAGAAVKRYPTPKVRETQERW